MDDGGSWGYEISGYTLTIFGSTFDNSPPPWNTLIVVDKPDCAIFKEVSNWNCGNPVDQSEDVAMVFMYQFQVAFPPGCEGNVCISVKGHPEIPVICFKDYQIRIQADILNLCGVSTLSNRSIDKDKKIYFSAIMKAYDEEYYPYPTQLFGEAVLNGKIQTIDMRMINSGDDYAEYISVIPVSPFTLFGEIESGVLLFKVNYGRIAFVSEYVCTSDAIKVEDILFEDNIPIQENPYLAPQACFPYNSNIKFGVDMINLESYWPRVDCQEWTATLKGYLDNELQYESSGELLRNSFEIEPGWSYYQLPGGIPTDIPGSEVNLNFKWEMSVADGEDRDILTDVTHMIIYNGFRANEMEIVGLEPDSIALCGKLYTINSNPVPILKEDYRIQYSWYFDYLSPSGTGIIRFSPDQTNSKTTSMNIEYPGEYELYYKIEDIITGTIKTSPKTRIIAKPQLEIISPADSSKFTYNNLNPGLLFLNFVAEANPSIFNDSIYWSVDSIGSSVLTTPSQDQIGDTVIFTYQGLPNLNSSFGYKNVYAKLPAYDVADTVGILIFYPRDEINNPGTLPFTPNWYYYWSQTNASCGTHVYGGSAGPGIMGGYKDGLNFFYIFDAAKDSNYVVYRRTTYYGIDNFAVTALHENQHLIDYSNFWGLGNARDTITVDKDPGNPWPQIITGDYIPDYLEPGLGLDSLLWDTNGDGFYDFDDRGYAAESTWTRGSADTLDWANPGKQY